MHLKYWLLQPFNHLTASFEAVKYWLLVVNFFVINWSKTTAVTMTPMFPNVTTYPINTDIRNGTSPGLNSPPGLDLLG